MGITQLFYLPKRTFHYTVNFEHITFKNDF